jgi:N-hydroxyarylamine O-acetyltransferase
VSGVWYLTLSSAAALYGRHSLDTLSVVHSQALVEQYFERLAYRGDRRPTRETLVALHRAHLLSVAFENLDIPLGNTIHLEPKAMLYKVLEQRRGGFCYELNGVFAMLLAALNFRVQLLSARVFNDGRFGPEFDHLLLLVQFDQMSCIADVGFGECFRAPLSLNGERVEELGMAYTIVKVGAEYVVKHQQRTNTWQPLYQFSLIPRALDEFTAMCSFQQTSPHSPFTRKSICSRATPDGRISLSNRTLIVTEREGRSEMEIDNAQHYRQLLKQHFQMALPHDADIERILFPGRHSPAPV